MHSGCRLKSSKGFSRRQAERISHIHSPEAWARDIFASVTLPDKRLEKRLITIVTIMARRPVDSIPRACDCWSKTKATYRFIENTRVRTESITKSITDATVRNCRGLVTVLAIQDTSFLSFKNAYMTEGLGYLETPDSRGMVLHSTIGVREDGFAVGAFNLDMWARDVKDYGKKKNRKARPVEKKESSKWLRGVHGVRKALSDIPPDQRPRVIHVCDREGDILDVFKAIADTDEGMVIRGMHNRRVRDEEGQEGKAFDLLRSQPRRFTMQMDVPRKHGQRAREATVAVRALTITRSESSPTGKPIRINLVEVAEENPPEKGAPLHWLLWTTEPVITRKDIQRVIDIYKRRWRIEEYHLILKNCCRVEELRLKNVDRLKKTISLYAPLAIRIMQLRDLAKLHPEAPCTLVLSEEEWRVLWTLRKKKPPEPGRSPPTVKEAVLWIGGLGGHLGRKGDGIPGVRTLCRGWRDLAIAIQVYLLFSG